MEKKDVPMDGGKYGGFSHKYYVPDENGDYVRVLSSGWEPLNIANDKFWESVSEDLAGVLEKVKKGELSPLAYHMNRHMMDAKVLAQYVGLPRWRVKRHLKPRGFNSLDDEALKRYASVFNITVEQLKETP
ncbi:MAG: hypothetical protein C0399_02330 [Syntrophus sp. (in: bacteria)]|nr:hypothetical protein [Syntrophus sp. (in: bacteria)]